MSRIVIIHAVVLSLCGSAGCARQAEVEAVTYLESGVEALASGSHEQAQVDCARAASALPENRTAHQCALMAAVALQDWNQAQLHASKLHQLVPSDWSAALLAETSRQAGSSLPPTLAIPPNGAGLWACVEGSCPGFAHQDEVPGLTPYQLALLRHAAGDVPGALQLVQQAPEDRDARRLHMLLLLQQGETDALKQLLLKSGPGDPKQSTAAVQIAIYLQHAAFFIAHYSKLLSGASGQVLALPDSASRWPPELQLVASAYAESINTAVRGKLESTPSAHPLPPDAQAQRFVTALRNRGENSTDLWSQLAQAAPTQPLHSLNAGVAHLQQGQLVSAIAHLEGAAALAPGEPLPIVYRYVAYLLQEDFQGASSLLAQERVRLPERWSHWLASLSPDEKKGGKAGRGKKP